MQNITLRAATDEDSERIADLFSASRVDAMPYLPILHTQVEVRWWIRNIVLQQTAVTVALADDQFVGFCSVRDDWLEHLYVATGAQGVGVGTQLLSAVQKKAVGKCGLRLHVFLRNTRARRFYEQNGFRLLELLDGSRNEEHEPDAIYTWIDAGRKT